jgi:hypothetical protein
MRYHLRAFLPLVLLFVLLSAVTPAVADETGGDETEGAAADTVNADEGDQPQHGIGDGDPSQFQNAPGSDEDRDAESVLGLRSGRVFHPTYKVEHKRDQDVASWTHNFTMNYPLSGKISFSANTNITTRTNDAANRLNRQENWSAGLNMRVTDAIGTGLTFRRNRHLDIQNEDKPNESRSQREKETVNLTTSYDKTYTNGINVSLGASAGLEKNKYLDVKSHGATQGITGRLSYSPMSGLSTLFDYSGNHSFLDSQQGDLSSTDELFDHNLGGHVDYKWGGHTFTVDMRRTTGKKEYPKNEQTEVKQQESETTGVSADLQLLDGMSAKVGFDYSRRQQYYQVEPSRNNDISSRGVDAHVTYNIGKTSFKADLGSDHKRNDYFDVQTGDNYTKTLSMNLTQTFTDAFDASLRSKVSLLSVHYDDIEENDQDRDLYNQEATLILNYRMTSDITTGLNVKIREDQLIYIRRTRTGDNKTTQKYAVEPFIRKNFTPRFSANQRYTLSADYTFYTYDEDSNFLIRNFSVSTGLNWKPFDPLSLTIDHTYRSQDEGSYVKDTSGLETYGKSSERADHSMTLGLKYKIADLVSIEVTQNLNVQDKWRINEDGSRTRTWDKFDTSIVGKAITEYSLADGTTLKASVARTLRDATSISDRQRQVWNISVTLNRTF